MSIIDHSALLDLLDERLSQDEIDDILFKLDLDWGDLPGDTKRAKLRNLIRDFERRAALPSFITVVANQRPDLELSRASITSASQPPVTTVGLSPELTKNVAGNSIRLIELFYSYSHRDEDLRDELEKHLSILRRQGVISNWHDRKISPGTEWEGQIDSHLNTARIILLLVSADFLASDYCYDKEMSRAMKRHEVGEARVIPVILRPCDWQIAPFSRLQALPRDGKPITTWSNRDEAFLDVAKGIRAAIQNLK